MARGVGVLNRDGKPSIAATIRRRVENGGEEFWRVSDFSDLPARTVARTLARLVEQGTLQRVREGLYYRPRETTLGPSRPSANAIALHSLRAPLHPAGLTAANVLGLTTQNPMRGEFATPAANPPSALSRAKVHTRRPASRARLNDREGALLELLRGKARYSDLPFEQTHRRLLRLLGEQGAFDKLARVALDEPPRVRAMLGALGQELGASPRTLNRLRRSLNPLSTFDFGPMRDLPHAKEWQAR